MIPFDRAFSQLSAQQFIDQVLVERLGAASVAVGENFRFGHGAMGDAAMLAADPRFATAVHPLLSARRPCRQLDAGPRTRRRGDVAGAARAAGRPIPAARNRRRGRRRGRELGFPTANIVPDPAYARPATASTPRSATRGPPP